jgi:hypothetical protein
MADYFIKEVIDSYKEHSQHNTVQEDCSECYKQNKLILDFKKIREVDNLWKKIVNEK